MNLLNPPEIADGGYWYVVICDTNGIPSQKIPATGWCAWSKSNNLAVLRTADPIPGFYTGGLGVNAALEIVQPATHENPEIEGKPRGRVGGY